MVQRIQSFWLFLAALLNLSAIFIDFYKMPVVTGANNSIGILNHYPSLLLAIVIILLPVATIFMYKKRPQQIRMCIIGMLGTTSLIGMLLARVSTMLKTIPANGSSYWLGAVVLPLAMICFVMAIIGIRKDEKLVRSVDRLR